MGVFMQLFQSNIAPQRINKLQAPYLCQNNANYLVSDTSTSIAIIKHLMCKNIKRVVQWTTFKMRSISLFYGKPFFFIS